MDKLYVNLKISLIAQSAPTGICVRVCVHGWLVNSSWTRTKKRKKEGRKRHFPYASRGSRRRAHLKLPRGMNAAQIQRGSLHTQLKATM